MGRSSPYPAESRGGVFWFCSVPVWGFFCIFGFGGWLLFFFFLFFSFLALLSPAGRRLPVPWEEAFTGTHWQGRAGMIYLRPPPPSRTRPGPGGSGKKSPRKEKEPGGGRGTGTHGERSRGAAGVLHPGRALKVEPGQDPDAARPPPTAPLPPGGAAPGPGHLKPDIRRAPRRAAGVRGVRGIARPHPAPRLHPEISACTPASPACTPRSPLAPHSLLLAR